MRIRYRTGCDVAGSLPESVFLNRSSGKEASVSEIALTAAQTAGTESAVFIVTEAGKPPLWPNMGAQASVGVMLAREISRCSSGFEKPPAKAGNIDRKIGHMNKG